MQTYARVAFPPRSTRTRWRFGSKRRLVATIEWLRLFPNEGDFPQTAHTFDIATASLPEPARYLVVAAVARSCAKASAISSAVRTASAALSRRASAC